MSAGNDEGDPAKYKSETLSANLENFAYLCF
jgi:hypothetical protein